MKRAYYSHCTAIYSTPQEDRDIATLEKLGFEVINPNSSEVREACERVRVTYNQAKRDYADVSHDSRYEQPQILKYPDAGAAIMALVFYPMMSPQHCDLVAFRALPDGRVPAGVAGEVDIARHNGLPIIELPSNLTGRRMSVENTREYLREIGQR